MAKMADEQFMREALALALRARGRTAPNPLVGAVVVARGGQVIGRGYHHGPGRAHAEILALKQAGDAARGATLFVTLEPCAHHGRTPACAPRVVQSGVRRVVAAMSDPNPRVAGRGFEILKQAGIQVASGVLEFEARDMNLPYLKHITTGLPYVILKGAMTLDGKIAAADGSSKWITSEQAQRDTHELRRDADAILVGANTLLLDDPSLTCRLPGRPPQPLRVVLDGGLRTRPSLKFVKNAGDGKSLIFTREDADQRKIKRLRAAGCAVVQVPADAQGRLNIKAVIRELGRRDVMCLLVEGGGAVHDAFFRARAADKVVFYVAPKVLGGAHSRSIVSGAGFGSLDKCLGLKFESVTQLGPDLKIQAVPVRP
jgi:diaminohydroxyphosphoribosylaminopyrimidine deaminase/5-amino-6-(5-phosphoribosylamino)uracil reductase